MTDARRDRCRDAITHSLPPRNATAGRRRTRCILDPDAILTALRTARLARHPTWTPTRSDT